MNKREVIRLCEMCDHVELTPSATGPLNGPDAYAEVTLKFTGKDFMTVWDWVGVRDERKALRAKRAKAAK